MEINEHVIFFQGALLLFYSLPLGFSEETLTPRVEEREGLTFILRILFDGLNQVHYPLFITHFSPILCNCSVRNFSVKHFIYKNKLFLQKLQL